MECRIRRMEEIDIDEAIRISKETLDHEAINFEKGTYPQEAHQFYLGNHTREKYQEDLKRTDKLNLVVDIEGKITGVTKATIDKGGLSFLGWTCIHPSYRGNGYGERMVQHVLDYCKKQGSHKISLHTLPMLRPAINLYMKLGFAQEALLKKHYWKMDFILMSKWFDQEENSKK
jgi:ribosomal protein S18 acetylase RimI-like enzyme